MSISAQLSVAIFAEDDWEPRPDVRAAFDDEIAWKIAQINARRRKGRQIARIDRDDLAVTDDSEEQGEGSETRQTLNACGQHGYST